MKDFYGLPVLKLNAKYAVVTSKDDLYLAAKTKIKDSIWQYNPEFLSKHSYLSEKAISTLIAKMGEKANLVLEGTIKDLNTFIEEIVANEGLEKILYHKPVKLSIQEMIGKKFSTGEILFMLIKILSTDEFEIDSLCFYELEENPVDLALKIE